MAGIYDIHTHLNDNKFIDEEISSAEIAKEAKAFGVNLINSVGFDVKSSKLAVQQAAKNKNVYAIVGIHPTQAYLYSLEAVKAIEELTYANKVVAIGEIGLDYKQAETISNQKEMFEAQLDLAKKRNLPVMLHIEDVEGSTKAFEDVLVILKEKKILKAVVHSFDSTQAVADKFLNEGYFISISGDITRDKDLQNIIAKLSLSKIMIETDAPYKVPKPFKIKINNHPKYITLIIDKIAKLKSTSSEEVISATHDNAKKFFGIK